MTKRNYGIPYMGSKNRIAQQIIDFLPSGSTLVDLFGGGGAITDCASESGKWDNIIYNELDKLPYTCFLKALKGEYENETRWISKEDFFKLKDTDEYVACCFSFGNNFRTYMYNEKIEPYKRAYHYAIVLDDFQPLSELFDEETVEMLKKSVEGETDKKQRRLKFTRVLGNYIIGLSKDAEVRKTVQPFDTYVGNVLQTQQRKETIDTLKKTAQIDDSVRNVLENQQRAERLDTLKKTVQIINGKFPGQMLQNQERIERLDLLNKTMVLKEEGRNGNSHMLPNQERAERLDTLRKTMNITNKGENRRNLLQNQERAERLDTLKKTTQFVKNKFPCNVLENQQRKETIDTLRKTINVTSVPPSNVLPSQERDERLDTLKKTVQIDGNKNKHNCIQHYPRLQRLQEMKLEQIDNITFFNEDYRNVPLSDNAIIYCDIPYRNTGKYNSSEEFDYDAFYDWCIEKKKQGYQVFISEYSMPEDKFVCVYELSKLSSLAPTKSSRVTEKIFIPK